MTADFKAEVKEHKDAMVEDLFTLLHINSERDDGKTDKEHSFGPGPVKALEHFLAMTERDGYRTRNTDNYTGDFEFGEGDEVLGIFAHLDIVPAGSGWDTDPYEPAIKDGRLYARGPSGDKGPTVACYYALKIIRGLGLPVSKKVHSIVDTDEESGWSDMEYYFAHDSLKDPDFGFSSDAEFPVINGEKGGITKFLHFAGDSNDAFTLNSLDAGLRDNMVPESATAIFTADSTLADLQKKLAVFAAAENLEAELIQEGDALCATVTGKSACGSTPKLSLNAAAYLAKFLDQFAFDGAAKVYLGTTANVLHKDFAGENLGVVCTDAKMDALSVNAGVFKFDRNSDDNTITLNFRYPQGTDAQVIKAELEKLAGMVRVTLSDHEHAPYYVPADDLLVSILFFVYEKQTGLKGYGQVIGGGTFGRLLKRDVAFGVIFPDYVNTIYQADGLAGVGDLYRTAAIYAEALYELVKWPLTMTRGGFYNL